MSQTCEERADVEKLRGAAVRLQRDATPDEFASLQHFQRICDRVLALARPDRTFPLGRLESSNAQAAWAAIEDVEVRHPRFKGKLKPVG
jgi:hypothetical protein